MLQPAARLREVEELCDDADSRVQKSNDPSSPEALELIEAAAQARAMARDGIGR